MCDVSSQHRNRGPRRDVLLATRWVAWLVFMEAVPLIGCLSLASSLLADSPDTTTRRIIYNDDGGAVKHMKSDDIEAMLDKRIKPLVGTQVDTVFYCGHDDFGKVFYRSKIEGVDLSANAGVRTALDNGVDPNRELINFCRTHGMEIFWSFRMNDIHDSYDGNLGKFKKDHPDWLLGRKDANYPKRSVQAGIWSALDFEVPQVRDHVFACIEEVCQLYDLDGVEFDYGRNASLFRPTFDGKPVTQVQLDILTDFQRRLRTLANKIGAQRGRPLLLTANVPDNIQFCRLVGIDVETWLAEGLLDFLIAGNGYLPYTMATRELIELGHQHGRQVYPRLDANTDDRLFWRHWDAWRGAATNFWQCGGDGVYLMNAYDVGDKWKTPHPRSFLVELGDPQQLIGQDKLYGVDIDLETISYGCGDIRFYMPRDHLLPMPLAQSDAYAQFYVGEDLPEAEANGLRPQLELQLRFDNLVGDKYPSLVLNDCLLDNGRRENQADDQADDEVWYVFKLRPEAIRQGVNKIQPSTTDTATHGSSAVLARAWLWIKYE